MDSFSQEKILSFFEQNACKLEVEPEQLLPSPLCDFKQPEVLSLHERLVGSIKDPEKIAQKIYQFLREKIFYEFDFWDVKASETLLKNTGMCFNKSNLMVALLRLSNISCVYSLFWIAKRGFRFTADEAMFQKIQPQTVHAYVEAYLGTRIGWRRYVDTSLDTALRRVLQKQGYEPFQNILTDLPIERFAAAEEVIEWRKRYKESVGGADIITKDEMEASNRKLRKWRR